MKGEGRKVASSFLSPSPYDILFFLLSFQLSRNNMTEDACYANLLNTTISILWLHDNQATGCTWNSVISVMLSCSQRFSWNFSLRLRTSHATQSAENEEKPGYGSASQPRKLGQPRSCNQVLILILRERTLERTMVRNKIPPKLAWYARAPEFQNTPQRHFVIRTITLLLQKRSPPELKYFPKSEFHFLPSS